MSIYVKTGFYIICLTFSIIATQQMLTFSGEAFNVLTSIGQELDKLP
jgi:hypothetical protein